MECSPEIAVTLSPELLERLGAEARQLGVPMEYLVASLVLDTFEEFGSDSTRPLAACA